MRDLNCVKSINTRSSEMTHASSVAVLEHYSKLLSVLDCKQSKSESTLHVTIFKVNKRIEICNLKCIHVLALLQRVKCGQKHPV